MKKKKKRIQSLEEVVIYFFPFLDLVFMVFLSASPFASSPSGGLVSSAGRVSSFSYAISEAKIPFSKNDQVFFSRKAAEQGGGKACNLEILCAPRLIMMSCIIITLLIFQKSWENSLCPATKTHLIDCHGDTLRKVSLNVLQKDISRGTCDFPDLHEPHVCPNLVLDPVLLVDVHRLQNCELLYLHRQSYPAGFEQ